MGSNPTALPIVKEAEMRLEEMSEKIIKEASKYVDLYFYEPLKAQRFYLRHRKVIDSVFGWNGKSNKEQKDQQLKSWMEFMNQ